jgi:hypothetical protein
VQNFPYRKDAWTFSFGDQTGYGFHADFISQWDTTVLQDAIDQVRVLEDVVCPFDSYWSYSVQCTNPDDQGVVAKCPPLVKSVNTARANACQPLHSRKRNSPDGQNYQTQYRANHCFTHKSSTKITESQSRSVN